MPNKPSKAELQIQALNLKDELDDIRSGFELWRDLKVAKMEWTQLDEMLARWIEHGPA